MNLLFNSCAVLTAIYAICALAAKTRYVRDTSLDGYNCDTNDIAFTINAGNIISCGRECSFTNTCFIWFYDVTACKCYGCSVVAHASNNALDLKNGTNYYKHACDSGWLSLQRGCYLVAADSMDFPTAWSYCEQRQSHLLYLETQSEISMITEYLLNNYNTTGVVKGFWLAMTDETVDGVWRWYGTKDLVAVFNWGAMEPGGGTSENHAVIYESESFKWHDADYNRLFNPICERN